MINNAESAEDIPQEEAVNTDKINEEYSREDLYKKFIEEFPIKNYNTNIIEEWFIKINYIPEEEKCKAIKRIQTIIHSEVIKDNLILHIKSLKTKPCDRDIDDILLKYKHKNIKIK